jgi:hypothetical protein
MNDGKSAEEKTVDVRRRKDLEEIGPAENRSGKDCQGSQAHPSGYSLQSGA